VTDASRALLSWILMPVAPARRKASRTFQLIAWKLIPTASIAPSVKWAMQEIGELLCIFVAPATVHFGLQ
jgi:hypothetical protein